MLPGFFTSGAFRGPVAAAYWVIRRPRSATQWTIASRSINALASRLRAWARLPVRGADQ
ncbi:hypothetical protein [Hymenobacter norwichensis]|uniref:hypothetical protein n=1 Tax=Hymenobacter norwichensis TaxID=223903 RepID=UPI0012FB22B2|nr:hypothetical protein [Hymenobacter norwichensis]